MRTLLAVTLFVFACGGPKAKKESSMVSEGSDSPDCCCKTIPMTAEREIIPVYATKQRMECSTDHGDCVDAVQCNAVAPKSDEDKPPGETTTTQKNKDGVPPPPTLGPNGTGDAVPRK